MDPDRGYKGERVEGLDFYVEHLTWKKLPKEVFEVYGGFEMAKEMREEMGFNQRVQIDVSSLVKIESDSSIPQTSGTTVAGTTDIKVSVQEKKTNAEKAAAAKEAAEKVRHAELQRKIAFHDLQWEDVADWYETRPESHYEELKKRFMLAALAGDPKRRRTEPGIITDLFPTPETDTAALVTPTISWALFDTK